LSAAPGVFDHRDASYLRRSPVEERADAFGQRVDELDRAVERADDPVAGMPVRMPGWRENRLKVSMMV
jgi:hypothetical protein